MTTWIAFLRGINVGGKNRLAMKELKALLEAQGFVDVATHIQSGNVVFRHVSTESTPLANTISASIEEKMGFRPRVVVCSADELRNAVAASPFGSGESLNKIVHLYFLDAPPETPDLEKLEAIKNASEDYVLKGKVFYLYTPDGFGKSKLATRAEGLLGVRATARNWRTVNAVRAIAAEY